MHFFRVDPKKIQSDFKTLKKCREPIFVREIGHFLLCCVFLVNINWLETTDFLILVLLAKRYLTRETLGY